MTPVRTEVPPINVVTPTSTPPTSVIALSGPGSPGKVIPRPRARGLPSLLWSHGHPTILPALVIECRRMSALTNRPSPVTDPPVPGICPSRHTASRPSQRISGTARPRRLFTVWFAPQVNMTGVFTGALAIVLGLGFWLGLLAMVIGTVLGSLMVGYLSTWGPRTGTGQLPNSRMAFGGGVVLPAALQWLSSIAWDALVGLFGGEALAVLLGIPFWSAVLIVLALQGVGGLLRLRGHPPDAGGADGGVVRDVRGVRGEARRRDTRSSRRPTCPRRGPRRRVRPRGDHRVQPGGVVGQLRRGLQPLPARGLVAGAGVRVHVRRNCLGVHLRSGHRHRGGRTWSPSRPPRACGR